MPAGRGGWSLGYNRMNPREEMEGLRYGGRQRGLDLHKGRWLGWCACE